jgi:UDP-N-acetylmuramoyl-L-alanyl-D-glutamate--2,6-diaminopimelate ligase
LERKLDPEPDVPSFIVPDARKFLAEISRIFYQDPASRLKLAAITGTNGKTTTAFLMDSIYRQAGIRSCLAGTLGMKIGDKKFPSDRTTSESPDLLRFLRNAVMEGCTHGALEVSSHSLVLKRVYATKFCTGIFMNLTPEHLDFHRDIETYFQAKQLLFSDENGNQIETAVINTDDPHGNRLKSMVSCPVLSFGFSESADIRAMDCQYEAEHTNLTLATPSGKIELHASLIGRPNIYNIMAAVGAACSLGIDIEGIRRGIEALNQVPGRLEPVNEGQDYSVVVDYAHSPDALENLLTIVRRLPHEKLYTVFGCGGDRDSTKRPVMGEIAGNMSDIVFATSDNPRSEDPIKILKEIEKGLRRGPAPYNIIPDRHLAIESAICMARKGDIVVIAGKGHEDYQIVGNRVVPFDDRKVAREVIRECLGKRKS